MKCIKILLLNICFFVMGSLVACQFTKEPILSMTTPTSLSDQIQVEMTPATVSVATPLATMVMETSTPSPTLIVPTNTSVPIVSQTPSPTKTMTPTPWPTLLPSEAVTKVLSLLQDNNNLDCLLPCWWGAVPGQTYWHDYRPFLKSFAIEIDDSAEKVAFATFPVPANIEYSERLDIAYRVNSSNTITAIRINPLNFPGYDPRTMMTLYGIPDEVWLKTFGGVLPGNVLPFQLIIVYQEQGISFRYYVNASSDGKTVTVCFEPGVVEVESPGLFPVGPRIYLWEPGQHKTLDEIANTSDETYYPLEEKTDLTSQTFYEKFTNPNKNSCIDTPADFWD